MSGRKDEARQTGDSLTNAAQGNPDLVAQSMDLQARIMEELYLLPEAVKIYDKMTQSDSVPVEWRRNALLKSVELTWLPGQGRRSGKKAQ